MLKELRPFKQIVSLVPRSGIQFLDFGLAIDPLKTRRAFWDQPSDTDEVTLRCLYEHEGELVYWDADSGRAERPGTEHYELNKTRALEPFLNKWVPLPFFRVDSGAGALPVFAAGPANWVRVCVVELPEREGEISHRVVLAVDTVQSERADGEPYLAPSPTDSAEFGFAPTVEDNGWLLSETWLDAWLKQLYLEKEQARRPGRPPRAEELAFGARHLACYLTLLQVLDDAGVFPRLRFIDLASASRFNEFIDVDFVLDIGNSRTCGLLIESTPDSPPSLKDNYVLELRDLSKPEQVYTQPFASCIEFSQPAFDKDGLSRESGRANAFSWPSVVRVGHEAQRLAALARGTEGSTGLSSPKRYLWDDRAAAQVWRFNSAMLADSKPQRPVGGEIMRFVTDEGFVLSMNPRRGSLALRPNFARGSLYTLMLCEILVQAFIFINSVGSRSTRKHELAPRRLRRLVLTLPPAMPVAEQKRLRERAQAAVRLLQDLMGEQAGRITVVANLDEATSTQLVYLYDQITTCFRSDADGYFGLMGKARPVPGAGPGTGPGSGSAPTPTLRLASIDIGGGTTDLSIMTYSILENRMVVPVQDFREGFRLAGDDVIEVVIMRQVLPAIVRHLQASLGEAVARQLMLGLFTGLGSTEPERQQRRQFVAQTLVPLALRLLHEYERWNPMTSAPGTPGTAGASASGASGAAVPEPVGQPFAWFFTDGTLPSTTIQDYLVSKVRAAGAREFALADVVFPIDCEGIDEAVEHTLGQVLSNLCEVIHAYDCDIVLLSGRPSRFPAIGRLLLSQLPVSADRIQPMHRYSVGQWYPYRDPEGRINDPKTTAAVGAMLCTLAEGQLEAFMLQASRFRMKSTARHIGEMEVNGQLLKSRVMFSDIDLDRRADHSQPTSSRSLRFFAREFLGFRQLGIERWPATRLYLLDFAHSDSARRFALPLKVTLERTDFDEDDPAMEEKKEDFKITSIEENDGTPVLNSQVTIRLQTLRDDDGYWLDTGRLDTLAASFSAAFAEPATAT
ncbi:Virulence protein SrfB [uncultured Gammaproteobacteria bacterium]